MSDVEELVRARLRPNGTSYAGPVQEHRSLR
jgi:hypothetical protein